MVAVIQISEYKIWGKEFLDMFNSCIRGRIEFHPYEKFSGKLKINSKRIGNWKLALEIPGFQLFSVAKKQERGNLFIKITEFLL